MQFYCQIIEFISSPLARAKLTVEAAKKTPSHSSSVFEKALLP